MPPGLPGVTYAFELLATGEPPPIFSMDSGALPAGITLSASGRIGGTPVAPGIFSGSIRASNGNPPDALLSFSIRIGGGAQSITFNAIVDQSIDARRVIATAVASSGLAVTLSSLTPQTCSMDGSAVSLLAAGRCTIRASQAGNAQFAAAPFVDRSFSVTQGAQAVMIGLPEGARVGAGPTHVYVAATSGLPVVLRSVTPGTCMVTDGTYVNFSPGEPAPCRRRRAAMRRTRQHKPLQARRSRRAPVDRFSTTAQRADRRIDVSARDCLLRAAGHARSRICRWLLRPLAQGQGQWRGQGAAGPGLRDGSGPLARRRQLADPRNAVHVLLSAFARRSELERRQWPDQHRQACGRRAAGSLCLRSREPSAEPRRPLLLHARRRARGPGQSGGHRGTRRRSRLLDARLSTTPSR